MIKHVFIFFSLVVPLSVFSQSAQTTSGSMKVEIIKADSTGQTMTDNNELVSPTFRRITPDFDRSAIEIDTSVATEFFRVMEIQKKQNLSNDKPSTASPLYRPIHRNNNE
jgi:hypothetical protein